MANSYLPFKFQILCETFPMCQGKIISSPINRGVFVNPELLYLSSGTVIIHGICFSIIWRPELCYYIETRTPSKILLSADKLVSDEGAALVLVPLSNVDSSRLPRSRPTTISDNKYSGIKWGQSMNAVLGENFPSFFHWL